MRSVFVVAIMSCTLVAGAQMMPDTPAVADERPAATVRVGVFDVQQAFNAYPGMQLAQQRSQELQVEMQQASEAQDQARMGEIQQEFQQLQQRAVQGFQQDLDLVLADVAREAQVPLVVQEVSYAAPNIESVDLTGHVVEAMRQAEAPAAPQSPDAPTVFPAPAQ